MDWSVLLMPMCIAWGVWNLIDPQRSLLCEFVEWFFNGAG
jgi:hypothetical protein